MKNLEIMTPWEFKSKLINEKKKNQQYNSGCLMGFFDIDPKDLYNEYFNINQEDIYNNEENEYGLEIEPHVTLLYGLEDDKIVEEDVIQLMNLIKMPTVTFEKISLFENENFDVLKWDLNREQLSIINMIIKNIFPNTESFPEYHPHATIAYLKPGTGKKYITEPNEIVKRHINHWVYSKADGKKIAIYNDGHVEILREPFNNNLENIKDTEIIEYKDYFINIKKHKKFNDGYIFSVFEGKNYFFGFRGPTTYSAGLKDIKEAIDSKIGKKERI